jgi:energy-coupling factor transporter ATP-binding protein EcfA2
MFLKSIKYCEYKNKPNAWSLDEFQLGYTNLVIGKNASGKTRTLNVIGGIADLVSGHLGGKKLPFISGDYKLCFENSTKKIEYLLGYDDSKIYNEELIVDQEKLLERGIGGAGTIYFVEEGKKIKFHVPDNELACVARRDSVQHPFFEQLFEWGKNTLHYRFGTYLGKDTFALIGNSKDKDFINLKETNKVVGILHRGLETYKQTFKKNILKDMHKIGYELVDIGVEPLQNISLNIKPDTHPEGVFVQEVGLNQKIYQTEISDGMFRALSLIIQLNFAENESVPSCILIDDVGEGLDFDRSSKLIKLVIEKSKKTKVQLILATNDKFVMNNVPLEYWSIIQRIDDKCRIYNYKNSKKLFDEFDFTGLNNFDFFSSNFYLAN